MEYIFFKNMAEIKGINPPKSQLGFKRMSKLCESAEKLFNKNGFFETSIADICANAKTAVGTFYVYFKDKTAVYNYLVKNYYAVIKDFLRANTEHCKTRFEMEREGLKAFILFGNRYPQCYKIIWGSIYINPELFEEYYTGFARGYIRALAKFRNELIDVDLSTAAYCLMGIANFVCLKTIFAPAPLTETELETLTDDAMKILSTGLFR